LPIKDFQPVNINSISGKALSGRPATNASSLPARVSPSTGFASFQNFPVNSAAPSFREEGGSLNQPPELAIARYTSLTALIFVDRPQARSFRSGIGPLGAPAPKSFLFIVRQRRSTRETRGAAMSDNAFTESTALAPRANAAEKWMALKAATWIIAGFPSSGSRHQAR
jgi:hypothetical protein